MTSTVLGVALAVSLTLSTILVVVLTRPLRLVLTTLCERGEGVSFWDMCRDVERAVAVSLQPIDLIGSEAVILFSDIFAPVPGMGVEVDFRPGPVIVEPIRSAAQVARLAVPDPRESAPFVPAIVRALRAALQPRAIPLLGFAGAPFTLASYAVEGSGSKNYIHTKTLMYTDRGAWDALMDTLVRSLSLYLHAQIASGCQAVQVFDSWAGCLSPADYREYVLPATQRLIASLPHDIPVIYFLTGNPIYRETAVDLARFVLNMEDPSKTPFRFLSREFTGLATESGVGYHGPGRASDHAPIVAEFIGG